MAAAFLKADEDEALRKELDKVRQTAYETPLQYNRRFRTAGERAYPTANRNADQNRLLVKAYARGLKESRLARKVVANGWPVTFQLP